ncbi:MAG TPA: hypothetical protein PKC13_01340 [Blastocatellia bacterium]|nr:hypothetical protein [Blastocatellia bacterium]HMY71688.1 hypothetical protein [Blastocatellia bacterium]
MHLVRRLADDLGIQIETGFRQFIGTATGVFPVRRHEVRLSVAGYEFDILACFAEDDAFSRNVLGRHGFLERVRLGLVDYEGLLYVSDYNEQ